MISTQEDLIDLIDADDCPVIGVASVKGGCGRSLIAGYLALELAHRYRSVPVYLVDLDIGTAGQFVLFRIPDTESGKFTGMSNLKGQLATAVLRPEEWSKIIETAPDLHTLEEVGRELFRTLKRDEGRLRLISGPGIQTKKIADFREMARKEKIELVNPLRNAIKNKESSSAIIILDLDAGIDGETPNVFRQCDGKILVVRPDRQHREILADEEIRNALVLKNAEEGVFLENFKLVFNFVPRDTQIDDLLDTQLEELEYKKVIIRKAGTFDSDILMDERFRYPIPAAFKDTIDELIQALFKYPRGEK